MKVLFLDIDGVANHSQTTQRFGGYVGINPEMAARIQKIITDTDCKVVLSSTWRLDASTRAHVRKEVCDFIDVTPDHSGDHVRSYRGSEIADWLQQHPEVTKYAILDDDDDFHPGQPLFKTSWLTGLTEEVATQVTDYLNAGVAA